MGGSGKTPTCVEIAKFIQSLDKSPNFLSRGYKSRKKNIVVSVYDNALDVGDEPLLLSQNAPVVIASDRIKGAEIAIKNNADVIIMDDGFQNPYLHKDFSIITIDGGTGFGNGKIFPSGPLREHPETAFKRANAIIIIGDDKFNITSKIKELSQIPIYSARVIPNPAKATELQGKNVIAFAGIGRPQKFYDTLASIGVTPLKTIDFPDHHNYSHKEIENLIKRAKENKAELITTQKDYVKLSQEHKKQINFLEISLEIDKVNELHEQIKKAINEKDSI